MNEHGVFTSLLITTRFISTWRISKTIQHFIGTTGVMTHVSDRIDFKQTYSQQIFSISLFSWIEDKVYLNKIN